MEYALREMGKRLIFLLSILSLTLIPVYAFADEGALTCPKDVKEAACHHNVDGLTHFKEGHWKVAAKHFSDAVKADPTFAEAHFNLALCYENMDKHVEATEHFKLAAKFGPNNEKIQKSEILRRHIGK